MQGAAQVLHGGNQPQPTLFPPEFLPPAPSQGEPGEQALPGPPEGSLEPESRKARMRHWTQGPHRLGVSMRKSWEGHRPEESTLLPSQPHPRLAASLSLQPSGPPDTHPNMA